MNDISIYYPGELKPEHALQIAGLNKAVWPDANKSVEDIAELFMQNKQVRTFYVMWRCEQAIAAAHTFTRMIRYDGGTLEIMALADVCVHKDFRGVGYGKKIVREVFRTIDEAPKGISLFQTDVPGFYANLGAVIIDNNFLNSTSDDPTKSPWWCKYVMVYANNTSWPDGLIDINGMGY